MTIGAPRYCWSEATQGPPGHRFRLYLNVWNDDFVVQRRGELPRVLKQAAGFSELTELVQLPTRDLALLGDVRRRQRELAKSVGALAIDAHAAAPFTTGLGNEHPLENGFAFLDPYGLPYLPGSGVKGVVRRAAEELALFEGDSHGWSIPAVWWLLGFEAGSGYFATPGDEPEVMQEERQRWREGFKTHIETLAEPQLELLRAFLAMAQGRPGLAREEATAQVLAWLGGDAPARRQLAEVHTRGALEFWDVIPEPGEGKLRVDIMNPHYNHYYQEGKAPGDWGNPVPIYFLTLPPGTIFTFIVRFRPPLAWPEGVRRYFEATEGELPRWKQLVTAALSHACDWFGFGAKTAVGYGRMAQPSEAPGHGTKTHVLAPPTRCQSAFDDDTAAAPVPPERRAMPTPGPGAGADAEMAAIAQRIRTLASAGDLKAEAESVANELARKHRHPEAAALAVQLWAAVETKKWLSEHLRRKAPIFLELVRKGGGA